MASYARGRRCRNASALCSTRIGNTTASACATWTSCRVGRLCRCGDEGSPARSRPERRVAPYCDGSNGSEASSPRLISPAASRRPRHRHGQTLQPRAARRLASARSAAMATASAAAPADASGRWPRRSAPAVRRTAPRRRGLGPCRFSAIPQVVLPVRLPGLNGDFTQAHRRPGSRVGAVLGGWSGGRSPCRRSARRGVCGAGRVRAR